MKITPNPELDKVIIDHLANLYGIFNRREPNHLSTYIYCLTKAYWEEKAPIKPTNEEVLLFSLGYGLQDVLTPTSAVVPVYEQDGIVYRPDLELQELFDWPAEIKTTRASPKTFSEKGFPDTWFEYMMGVCFLRGVRKYELIPLYLMGYWRPPVPMLQCQSIEFEEDEILDNWSNITSRKNVLDSCLQLEVVPQPFQWCKDWECAHCRYKMVCDAQVLLKGYDDVKVDQREQELIEGEVDNGY